MLGALVDFAVDLKNILQKDRWSLGLLVVVLLSCSCSVGFFFVALTDKHPPQRPTAEELAIAAMHSGTIIEVSKIHGDVVIKLAGGKTILISGHKHSVSLELLEGK